jgi:exonuclease III
LCLSLKLFPLRTAFGTAAGLESIMELSSRSSSTTRDRVSNGGSTPDLNEYLSSHPVRGVPLLGRLELRDCVRLILYNVQGFTTSQIWTELRASLGDLARSILKIKRVAGKNRNPHAELWVRRDTGAALVSVIRRQTKTRYWQFARVVTEAERLEGTTFDTATWGGDDVRFAQVTHWRIALWQSWRERRMEPVDANPVEELRPNLTSIATWNINGFWRKVKDIEGFVEAEKVAVLALQETLVKASHYKIRLRGYRAFTSNAKEDFRGMVTLVDEKLSAYEVPHGLSWLVHVKVFGYAGWSGPTHVINVYLKSGGNFRAERARSFTTLKRIINNALKNNPESRFVVLGDFNEENKKVHYHLNVGTERNPLQIAPIVGSSLTRFPIRGSRKALDHILLNVSVSKDFKCARVLRNYNASDHRPVMIKPRKELPSVRLEKSRVSFDNKMIRLKSDFVVNDNSWLRLMDRAYGKDIVPEIGEDADVNMLVSDQQLAFAKAFDTACRKHGVKKDHKPGARRQFPRKIKALIQTEQRHRRTVERGRKHGHELKELDFVKLARAQARLKKAKREWEIRLKKEFYAQVVDDFVAHDHKNVWNRLDSLVRPNAEKQSIHPVKDKDGVLHYSADEILDTMKQHYQDLLTYDPDGKSLDMEYWANLELGDKHAELVGLNDHPMWPEILVTIRESNRNTAPGKDGVHINVLKAMVLEECMAKVKLENPRFKRPDNIRIDLPEEFLPIHPLTPMGKALNALIQSVWYTGCIPKQWSEVQIVNLFKGGDTENTNNYRGISLISCAFKVLLSLMATRLSRASEEAGLITREQGGFRKREEAVAQAVALAEIVRRRWLGGKPTYGAFIDFKKAYDRVYHGHLFRLLDHVGIRGGFLDLIKTMYKETRYEVRMGDLSSESFTPTRGAKQGDPLSPILFIIYINSCLERSSVRGVRPSTELIRCKGLMYADDVIGLESDREDVQAVIDNVRDWGVDYGMELGRDKCGVIMWPGKPTVTKRKRRHQVLDLDSSDSSSDEDPDEESDVVMRTLEFEHDHYIYSTADGIVPTVKNYKYLGINLDTRLGDPRKIVPGQRSMELEFAFSQAAKGMRVIHALRPFLTDRFCPIAIKVMTVRNLVYSKMLYGAELIGFQAVHAEPMQRVINIAAKWIMGMQHRNTQVDAFTLCYELGLPPVHQEMSALRARLAFKLRAHTDGGLNSWLQKLYDSPPTDIGSSHTWVTLSQKWLKEIKGELSKYNQIKTRETEGLPFVVTYDGDDAAPLRPWGQLGKAFEMSVRSNSYSSKFIRGLRSAFLGETDEGEPPRSTTEAPLSRPIWGELDAAWDLPSERTAMDRGRIVPEGRTRGEVTQVALVRDAVLERMMSSNKSKGFTRFYDFFSLGTNRGYLRDAATRPDLAEGIRWLSLVRTRAFPTVEGAWQRIKRSGQNPPFMRGCCPLCGNLVRQGWDWAHLLAVCPSVSVRHEREVHLRQSIDYLVRTIGNRDRLFGEFMNNVGREERIGLPEALSIYLIGGLFRRPDMLEGEGWMDAYFIGFGSTKLICPGFESFGWTYVASFLQVVAPRFVSHLGEPLIGRGSPETSPSASSTGSPVNQPRLELLEDIDPPARVAVAGSPPAAIEE